MVISEIDVRPGTHCLFASLRRMLSFAYGLHLPEAEIYFRCDGLNVEYEPASQPFWIGRSGDGMLRDCHADGPVRLRYSFDLDDLLRNRGRRLLDEVGGELAAGKPVMLFVHSGSLTYHAVYRENPSRPHVVFLYGIDEPNDCLHICDSFLLDYSGTAHTFQGPASLSDVLGGVYGVCFMEDRQPSFTGEEHFPSLLRERIDRFLDDRPYDGSESVVRGLSAYRAFFDRLESAADLDKQAFTDLCKEAYYCLRIGSVIHQWTYFLQLVQVRPALIRHGADYWTEKLEQVLLQWNKNLLNLYKTGLRGDRANWPSVLKQSKLLLGRQVSLLHHFIDDLAATAAR